MTDPRLEINAASRAIPPAWDTDTPLFSLAWQATQKWSGEIRRLRQSQRTAVENENQAWITLADECFRLRKVQAVLAPAMEQCGLSKSAQDLTLVARRLEQTLRLHDVEIDIPTDVVYSAELSEVLESIELVPKPDIAGPVVQEVIVPIVKRAGQVIRFGKAIVAVPDGADTGG
jgi:hypothetical protein